MDSDKLSAVYEQYQTSWIARDWTRFRRTLHPDYSFSVSGVPVGAVTETIEWSALLLDAFPDFHQVVNAIYPWGSVLGVEAVASGTSNGKAPSLALPAPEPGRRLQLPYVKVLRFEDGLIRDDRQYHDVAAFMAQLYPQPGRRVSAGPR